MGADAELIASEREVEIVSGRRAPDPSSNALLRYVSRYQKPPTAPIDSVAREDDVVGGFRVVLSRATRSAIPRSCGTRTGSILPATRSGPC